MNLNLRLKLFIPVLVSIGFLMLTCLVCFMPNYLAYHKTLFISNQANALKTLHYSLAQDIVSHDLARLHGTLDRALAVHKNEWLYLKVSTPKGQQIYPVREMGPISDRETVLSIKQTISEQNIQIASIELIADWGVERQQQRRYLQYFQLSLIVLLLVAGGLAFFWQTRSLLNPIRLLQKAIRELSEGKLNNTIPSVGCDELGQLANDLEKMRIQLNQKISALSIAQQKAEHNEARKNAILNASYLAILTIQENGMIESANIGAELLFGYEQSDLIGLNITLLIPPNAQYNLPELLQQGRLERTRKPLEVTAYSKMGLGFAAELAASKILLDGKSIYTCFISDISDRKTNERLRSEFITIISHELRTPLTAIYGALGLMKLPHNADPQHQSLLLDVANRNSERLLRLLNDLLDIAKLEAGKIQLSNQTASVSELMSRAIADNQVLAEKMKIDLIQTDVADVFIRVDFDRMIQVLSNLIDNAVKFSTSGGCVELSAKQSGNLVRINIKDYGCGIPSSFYGQIFNKFAQYDTSNNRRNGGAGLGLNIAKQLVEHMNGDIGFSSIEGVGSTFYVEFSVISPSKLWQ